MMDGYLPQRTDHNGEPIVDNKTDILADEFGVVTIHVNGIPAEMTPGFLHAALEASLAAHKKAMAVRVNPPSNWGNRSDHVTSYYDVRRVLDPDGVHRTVAIPKKPQDW